MPHAPPHRRVGHLAAVLAASALGAGVVRAEGLPGPGAGGWLSWRGPAQRGVSDEAKPPVKLGKPSWSHDLRGRGSPVVAVVGGKARVYAVGWRGEGADLQELLVALDAQSGRVLWQHGESDFLSDTIYERYGIGAPAVDGETGAVYAQTANGLLTAFDPDGKILWQRSMMEELGRLTFPNARTGGPIVDGDLVIARGITANWGAQGAPRDRLYAFDKRTGALVWASTPGEQPKDNSFSTPVLAWQGGRRVLFVGTGCGHVACIDARTGQPLWRYAISSGGVNSSLLVDDQRIYAIHGVENLDESTVGRMVAIDRARAFAAKPASPGEPAVLDKSVEAWRASVSAFSASPVLDGGRVYAVSDTGELFALEAGTGAVAWKLKLARDQVHASPLLAGGRLYVPMNDGSFQVVVPGEKSGKVVSSAKLDGNLLGAPAAWGGQVFVQSTARLYAFGSPTVPSPTASVLGIAAPVPGPATQLQARPSEALLRPGDAVPVSVRKLDALGNDLGPASPTWKKFVPPGAKVQSFADAEFDAQGRLVAGAAAKVSAGAYLATDGALTGTLRARVLPSLPITEDFESFAVTEKHATEKDALFAYPPLPWIGGRFAWEVRKQGDSQVLAKTLDVLIRQRAQTFIGPPDLASYTIAADVMSDGNKRLMSDVGLIDQRYLVTLKGTWQQLEVSSNHERLKVAVPFAWQPGAWYRLLVRVDAPDKPDPRHPEARVVRAKAWKKGEPEPAAWTIEVPHTHGHARGAPGLFGFAPDARFRVYVDNVSVSPTAR